MPLVAAVADAPVLRRTVPARSRRLVAVDFYEGTHVVEIARDLNAEQP